LPQGDAWKSRLVFRFADGSLYGEVVRFSCSTGMLIRDLPTGASANGHVVAFTPKPRLLRSTMRPEGEETYLVDDRRGPRRATS
jgi:hypothetical protein